MNFFKNTAIITILFLSIPIFCSQILDEKIVSLLNWQDLTKLKFVSKDMYRIIWEKLYGDNPDLKNYLKSKGTKYFEGKKNRLQIIPYQSKEDFLISIKPKIFLNNATIELKKNLNAFFAKIKLD